MHELLDADPALIRSLRKYVPNFEMVLDDVTELSDHELYARTMNATVQLVLMMFRDARTTRSAEALLRRSQRLLEAVLNEPHGRQTLMEILHYVLSANRLVQKQQWTKAFAKLANSPHTPLQEIFMTAAEQLRIEGRKEG